MKEWIGNLERLILKKLMESDFVDIKPHTVLGLIAEIKQLLAVVKQAKRVTCQDYMDWIEGGPCGGFIKDLRKLRQYIDKYELGEK